MDVIKNMLKKMPLAPGGAPKQELDGHLQALRDGCRAALREVRLRGGGGGLMHVRTTDACVLPTAPCHGCYCHAHTARAAGNRPHTGADDR